MAGIMTSELHMDNDEDNVNAFGDDVNGVIGQ